ncbi:MAG: 1-deoxy-D-xylulose-5-phosphate reductoisomerase [Lachnospiraceae bacterium]|nr:1-deoxy-D-xylulose-5-phosphate reductoisomerase [Lachnospiraceae bacterium]
MMKKLAILGSTGSIGTQTLQVVSEHPEDFRVVALAANRNIDLLETQIRTYRPGLVCVYDEESARELRKRLGAFCLEIASGMEGLIACATHPDAEIVLGAIVGMIGLRPTIEAIKAGKDIAIANKETLVTAGHLILPLAMEKGVKLLPVDSEHSAIFQCLEGERKSPVSRILLTASGGPFRGCTKEQLENVRPEDALKHPNWHMGAKITVDSSTMVNKGLEVIEAHWLFGMPYDRIEVVVQPQSVIHSMVEFSDGAVKAQMGTPDMRLPIQYALFYPERRPLSGERLDFSKLSALTFERPDTDVFEGLKLAYDAGKRGGNAPTVLNAANEWAVAKFLKRELSYLGITESIKKALDQAQFTENPSLDDILETERKTYRLLNSI